jgi:S1-C subfamily serine protease
MTMGGLKRFKKYYYEEFPEIKLFVLLSIIITCFSGCSSALIIDGGIYPPVKINQKSGESSISPCYEIREVAVTKNKHILVGFGLVEYETCTWQKSPYGNYTSGIRVKRVQITDLKTEPKNQLIKVFGIQNTHLTDIREFFLLIKSSTKKIIFTSSQEKGYDFFSGRYYYLMENPIKMAQLSANSLQTSLTSKESIDVRDTLNLPIRPKPLPSAIQSPKAKPSITQSEQPPIANKQKYSGTGFMFGSKDYVITNWHVIRGAKNIKVKFLNGEKINGEVILKDSQNDIAFLKLERPPQLPQSDLKVGDSSKVRMGDKVFTIGYPAHWVMGQNPKYTEGVVNALSGIKEDPTVFQISVQIQPGNSGGPLFNESGKVIGITQSTLDPQLATESIGALPQNVNYAVKSSYISALLPMLPQTLIASRGIVIVPKEPENTLANFIAKAKKNIVLIEATD